MNRFYNSENKRITLALFIYFTFGCLLVPFYRYSQRGDIVSYLSISEKYINGNLSDAINGVWSPLLSWLLIPVFWVNVEILLGFKILQLIIGLFILFTVSKYYKLFGSKNESSHYLLLATTSIIIYYFAFFLGSPDLLVAAFLLYYLYYSSKKEYLTSKAAGWVCGLVGAIAFYSKAFSLPFFVFHFALINAFYFYRFPSHRSNIRKNYLQGFGLFILLCSIWIVLISLKYGYFTYSTAGGYNFNIIGPKYESVNTFRINSLYPPANATAVSYWEDPTFLPVERWNPFVPISNLVYFVEHILNNIVLMLYYIFLFSPFLLLLVIFKYNRKLSPILVISLVSIITYSLGYIMLFIYERFIILIYLLVVVISFWLMINLIDSLKKSRLIKIILLSVFIISLVVRPIYSTIKYFDEGSDLNILAQYLELKKISGRYAGISNKPLDFDWSNTIFLAYRTKSQFYGEINADQEIDRIYEELKKYDINYLFDWRTDAKIIHHNFEEVFELKFANKEENPFNKIVTAIDFLKLINRSGNQRITGSYVKVYKMIYQ
ncbi:MAG: hypothetical protein IPM56_10305 [Ignavibacteriales bacterium]|nr:MAG: hypothetical protein IPM56_10305 [Ignavibacteriales bacterium]